MPLRSGSPECPEEFVEDDVEDLDVEPRRAPPCSSAAPCKFLARRARMAQTAGPIRVFEIWEDVPPRS